MLARAFHRSDGQAPNFGKMIRRLGIEPAPDLKYDNRRDFHAALRRCVVCRRVDACSSWLDANTGSVEAAPSFCPNAIQFQSMRNSSIDANLRADANMTLLHV